MAKEFIFKLSDALYDEKTGEAVFMPENMGELVRCCKCCYWDRDTIRYQHNDFRAWNEAECMVLAERDGYNEIDHYVEADDYCSRGERRTDE